MDKDIIPIAQIEERIYVLRGRRVMKEIGQQLSELERKVAGHDRPSLV
jgi:hypothetical protein